MRKIFKSYFPFLFFIFIFVITALFSYFKLNESIIESSFNYVSSDNSSYDVFYNGLFDGKTNNSSFIRRYVDKINFNFDYFLDFSSSASGNQNVLVKASVVVLKPNSESVIWTSDSDYLLQNSYSFSNTRLFRFNDSVLVDYKKYLDIYNSFKNDSSITSNSYILVEFISSSKVVPFNMNDLFINDSISYKIPLSDVTFEISKDSNVSNKVVNVYKENNTIFYLFLFRFSYAIIFISLICLFFIYYFNNKKKDKFNTKISKILRSYNGIIVNISNMPNFSKRDVIMVNSFYELLNAQMELRVPINFIHYENAGKFFIIGSGVVWMFILRRDNVYEKKL